MTQTKKPAPLGDLLAQSGLLPSNSIAATAKSFVESGLPLGKALVLTGHLTDRQMRLALDIQSLVNEDLMPFEVGAKVLSIASKEGTTLDEAFVRAGFAQPADVQTNRLGQLLLDAGVISKDELEECLETNARTALPLGHVLSLLAIVSTAIINTALASQQFIRERSLDRAVAIEAIKAALKREQKLKPMSSRGYARAVVKRTLMLGELLTQANKITEQQLVEALYQSIIKAKFVGETLTESFLIEPQIVIAAVALQEMLDNRTFKPAWAIAAISALKENYSIARSVAEIAISKSQKNMSVLLIEVLLVADLLRLADIPKEVQEMLKDDNHNQALLAARILVDAELVSESAMTSALRCVHLMEENFLDLEQSIIAMDLAVRKGWTIDRAIHELGWIACTRLHTF